MKQNLIIIFFLISMITLKAQVNNGGFENWTNMGNYEVPDGWSTMNHATSHLNIYTVTKWYPGSPGNWYMKITSKMYGMNVMNGIAVYGKLDSTNMQPVSGYPFTQQPASFTGQWQHMIWGTSQGSVCATLTKWNSALNKRDTVAIAYEELFDMAMSWEAFSVEFNYLSMDQPDSCMIVLKSSGNDPELNDYLWVDDLAFSGSVSIGKHNKNKGLLVFPNPGSDQLNVKFDSDNSYAEIELSDISGKVLLIKEFSSHAGINQFNINVSEFSKGTYFLKFSSGNEITFQKVVVN